MGKDNDWKKTMKLPILAESEEGYDSEYLEWLFFKSVSLATERCFHLNNGKISMTLSGGVDSSFCLALAREQAGNHVEIHTHTVGITEEHPDIHFARIAAKRFKTIHHELFPTNEMISQAFKILSKNTRRKVSPGDVAVFLAYQMIKKNGFKANIAHDGIDEILGGYPGHRFVGSYTEKLQGFRMHWSHLQSHHIDPLLTKAAYHDIEAIFPYLDLSLVEYLTKIPLDRRTTRQMSKIPLREIARKYLPIEIIERQKSGFCDALNPEKKV